MNIIRIATNNEISIHPYPKCKNYSEENSALYQLIGDCDMIEHVMPKRLYSEVGGSNKVSQIEGSCVSMLIDEEGLLKYKDINVVASYLYESDRHGSPIVGNVLIVGEKWERNGFSFCGISEIQFNTIFPKLKGLVEKAGAVI